MLSGRWRLPALGSAGEAILELRLQRLTALGRDETAEALNKLRWRDRRLPSPFCVRARAVFDRQGRADRGENRPYHAAPDRHSPTMPLASRTRISFSARTWSLPVSHLGYVKRVPLLAAYRAQRRGGKGRAGMQTRDEDFCREAVCRLDAMRCAVLFLARSVY
mgnify:CR=1 FL=1